MIRQGTEEKIEKLRNKTDELIHKGKYEDSLLLISCLADILYRYNQDYTDRRLEMQLERVRDGLKREDGNWNEKRAGRKAILFYDGFGLDRRGLALIYLKALTISGYEVIYVVREKKKENIPTILALLEESNAKVIYVPDSSLIGEFRYLSDIFRAEAPEAGFLYTTPDDVSGIMAFSDCKDIFVRYQINLTDHAFWLGVHAFDYCIEFRDYGASISHYYREIPKERIFKQPFYPFIDQEKEFEGFPFEKGEKDFILFSGGSLYKTIDRKENIYYKLVDFCLREFDFVKFWYAGSGDDTELVKLREKYPGRIFHTGERNDLYQILQHIDLYLNTYPMVGGLMMQYSAEAGKLPLTLRHGEDGSGLLINQGELGIEFESPESIKEELRRIIGDRDYRTRKEQALNGAVISPEQFNASLLKMVQSHTSGYEIEYSKPDTQEFLQEYADRFGADGVERAMAKIKFVRLAAYFPEMFIKGVYGRGGGIAQTIFRLRF